MRAFPRRRTEIAAVYLTGLIQGICLVTFPAAGSIFRSPEAHGLTSNEYGTLFLPMIVCAIFASSLGGGLAVRWGSKRVFLLGLAFNLISMILLALSQTVTGIHNAAYGFLLLAMGALGVGFGGTLTMINTYAAGFFPEKTATALTVLHAILGTGTALAPILLTGFVRAGGWWGQPVAIAVGFLILIPWALSLPLETRSTEDRAERVGPLAALQKLPAPFWGFGAIAVLYGICETLFGNWATIYLHEEKRLSLDMAALALSTFWALVTVGRLLVAGISLWLPPQKIYRGMPLLILAALLGIPSFQEPVFLVMGFAVAGLACSAFLPLTIGFAERNARGTPELASGVIVAAYMLGFGVGAYGVGPIRDSGGISISAIYTGSGVFAAGMAVLGFLMTRKGNLPEATQVG